MSCSIPHPAHLYLNVGGDVSKLTINFGMITDAYLARHKSFRSCPSFSIQQSGEGFEEFMTRVLAIAPIERIRVLLESTGHYGSLFEQFLVAAGITVYRIHPNNKRIGLVKTDQRDALDLANHLYNCLDKKIEITNPSDEIHRVMPLTPFAACLGAVIRHRYELIQDKTRHKNRLNAIAEELFPELVQVYRDMNTRAALALRRAFPTPDAIAGATLDELRATRIWRRPSDDKLTILQALARTSIGTKDEGRRRGLILAQEQLIDKLSLIEQQIEALDTDIKRDLAQRREGLILTSISGIGPILAATLIATIGNIARFETAGRLRSYLGFAPSFRQSGTSLYRVRLTRGGSRLTRQALFLGVCRAIQDKESEWAKLYERLVSAKCVYDPVTKRHKGKRKVIMRVAGQMISLIYLLLRLDYELLRDLPEGQEPPAPTLYDQEVHRRHREGHYQPARRRS